MDQAPYGGTRAGAARRAGTLAGNDTGVSKDTCIPVSADATEGGHREASKGN
jgi:hypothetical protein